MATGGVVVRAQFTSNLAAFKRAHRMAVMAGLVAAALVLERDVKARLLGGYTSGAFYTGASRATIGHSSPEFRNGEGNIEVGAGIDPPYPYWWEVGHENLFTGRFERVEVWRPAMLDTRERQAEAFRRAYYAEMRQHGFDGRQPAVQAARRAAAEAARIRVAL